MAIHVRCDECGATYEVPADSAGQSGKCRCGSLLTVPGGNEAAPAPVAGNTRDPGHASRHSPPGHPAPTGEGDGGAEARRAYICAEIRRWHDKRLIPRSLATRLLAEYDPHRQHTAVPQPRTESDWPAVRIPMTPGMVLLYLGGLLVVSAALLLIADVWKDLGDGGRFLLVLAPTAALYGFGAYLCRSDESRRIAGTVLLFFGCLIVPLALQLGMVATFGSHASASDMRTRSLTVAVVTFAIHVGTLIGFRSPLFTILYPMSFLWLVGQGADLAFQGWGHHVHRPIAGVMVVAGLLLMGAGTYHAERGKRAYAAVPDFVGATCALGALLSLTNGHEPFWELVSVLASLGAIALSVPRRNSLYLAAGSLYLLISIFTIGFEYFSKSAGLPLTLMVCGGLSIAAGCAVHRVRKEYLEES